MPERHPARAGHALRAFLLYLGLTLLLTYPLLLKLASAIPGDSFDGWQNYWNLWWLKQSLVDHLRNPYWTDLLYYPTGVGLLFHTLNPFDGLLTLPVQLAGNLFLAYNAVVLFSFAAGGLGAYLLARRLLAGSGAGTRQGPALMAGLIFTFSPFHFAHLLGHMQLIALEWIPFYVLTLWRGLERARRGTLQAQDALMPGLFLVLVALCDWYYVLYCLLLSALLLPAFWPTRPRLRPVAATGLRLLAVPLAAGVFFLLVLSPVLLPMVQEARAYQFMVPPASESVRLSADLLAFVTPQGFHPLWGAAVRGWADRTFSASFSEYTVFTGYTTLVLALLGVWRYGRRAGVWLVATLSFFVLALGPVLHVAGRSDLLPGGGSLRLPYGWLVQVVPFMRISRSVSRFDVMVMLGLAVLAAYGVRGLPGRPGRARGWLTLVLTGLVLFEFWPAPYPLSAPDTPPWYAQLAATPGSGAVLNLPMNWDRPGYLLYQTVHGRPLTVGYISRDDPRTLTTRTPVLQTLRSLGPDVIGQDLGRIGSSVLNWLGVEYVVLDDYKMPGARERGPTHAIVAQVVGQDVPYFRDERLTVYRVTHDGPQQPFLVLGDGWGPREVVADRPQRVLDATAHLRLIHAQPAMLHLTLQGSSGSRLRISDPHANAASEIAVPASFATVDVVLDVVPGPEVDLTLQTLGDGRVTVRSLDLTPR